MTVDGDGVRDASDFSEWWVGWLLGEECICIEVRTHYGCEEVQVDQLHLEVDVSERG